jgi:hypothetical protein
MMVNLMNNYPSAAYLQELKEHLQVYYAQFDRIKPKRLNKIEKEYKDVYDSQYDIIPVINEIEISHLLGCNEIVIPHLKTEYDKLMALFDNLKNGYKNEKNEKKNGLKDLKAFGELMKNMEKLTKSLLEKDLENMKRKDIEHLIKTWDIDINVV